MAMTRTTNKLHSPRMFLSPRPTSANKSKSSSHHYHGTGSVYPTCSCLSCHSPGSPSQFSSPDCNRFWLPEEDRGEIKLEPSVCQLTPQWPYTALLFDRYSTRALKKCNKYEEDVQYSSTSPGNHIRFTMVFINRILPSCLTRIYNFVMNAKSRFLNFVRN